MLILPGVRQVRWPGVGGKSYIGGPVKILLHTWEGTNWTSFRNAVDTYPPHVAASWYDHQVEQYVPLDLASYALLAGDTEHCIQVEMAGFARETQNWRDENLKWLADNVFKPILALVGPVPRVFYECVGGEGYGENSPYRRGPSVIRAYSGWLAHQHMYGNSHWDAGRFRLARLLEFVYDTPPIIVPPTPPPLEDDVSGPFDEFYSLQEIVVSWYVHIDGRDEDQIDGGGFDYWTGILAAAVAAAPESGKLAAIAGVQHQFAALVALHAGLQPAPGGPGH